MYLSVIYHWKHLWTVQCHNLNKSHLCYSLLPLSPLSCRTVHHLCIHTFQFLHACEVLSPLSKEVDDSITSTTYICCGPFPFIMICFKAIFPFALNLKLLDVWQSEVKWTLFSISVLKHSGFCTVEACISWLSYHCLLETTLALDPTAKSYLGCLDNSTCWWLLSRHSSEPHLACSSHL